MPAWAQQQQDASGIISEMQADLDLSPDQIYNITPIVERYLAAMNDLQKSVSDGTMNSSAVDSQKQQLEAVEEQGLSQYLKPYQLSEWRQMQAQMQQKDGDGKDSSDDADVYTNYPRDVSSQ